ncbi:RNA methyltransferase [Pseudofulvibacter geojedonensis]|uniref:RNA methyltransferase n=1 Tax=Pseudofulvibacter geojedonensis TaxID=1123758 RepID=A0ABW3I0U6_9FLAO
MLSKNTIKLITSLKQKKYRYQHRLFVVEGKKTILEFLASDFVLESLYTVVDLGIDQQQFITEKELQRISFLKNTNSALAIFKFKKEESIEQSGLIIGLDNIRDPGNLGTIIRLCDWFGVTQLLCNKETVDCFNPKVVQATMGSLTRVNVSYLDLKTFLKGYKKTVYGTFMSGESIYSMEGRIEDGLVIMGNEANGISEEVEQFINYKISIPRFGKSQLTESLNVATATAITLSELKRKAIEM